MKCAACGYEYYVESRKVDKVVYYQSGKRKGEIKEVKSDIVRFEVGDEDFIRLFFRKDVDELGYEDVKGYNGFSQVDLCVCPKCKTVRIE